MSKRSPAPIEVKLHAVQQCLAHKSNPNYEAKLWLIEEFSNYR